MRLSRNLDEQPKNGKASKKRAGRSRGALSAHRAFVPLLTAWGAALLGLSMLVLPAELIARIGVVTSTGSLGAAAKPAYAAIAALLGGGIAYVLSAGWRARSVKADDNVVLALAAKAGRVRPIDPASELGSDSLDAPIEEQPFASPETAGEEIYFTRKHLEIALIEVCEAANCEAENCGAENCEAAQEDAAISEAEPADLPEAPRALDLAEFAAMPGRNAVWVEEQAEPEASSAEDTAPAIIAPEEPVQQRQAPLSALEKLRQKDPEELSLVEMVERFAGALHERQQASVSRPSDELPQRDAALAEALRALTLFTQDGFDTAPASPVGRPEDASSDEQPGHTERELREALTKLQPLSGAA